MQELWASTSYEPHLLSLPFALAPIAMMIVIAYTAVMRGAPVLRGYLLGHFVSLLPYATVMMLSPSITSPEVAELLFRVAASTIPLAAATGTGFQLSLIRRHRKYRWLIWFLIANALVWVVVGNTTNAAVDGVHRLSGFWYPIAGPWAWLALIHTMLISIGGFLSLGYVCLASKPSHERRQLRLALLANTVTYAGLVDVALAYGFGVFPFGWLLSGAGSLLVVRALIVEDLLRVRAVDTTAPLLVLHFAGAAALGWVCLLLIPDAPWWGASAILALCFIGVRNTISTFALIDRGARGGEGPLERLIAQFVSRARALAQVQPIAQLAIDIIDLGVGIRIQILLAAEEDWGWTTLAAPASVAQSMFPETMPRRPSHSGRILDEHAPDPLLMSWLAEYRQPLFRDDLDEVPADLRELAERLLDHNKARAIIAVRSTDEILALIIVPTAGPRLRGRSLAFVERVAERLAEAMLHARMATRAAERAVLAREVELAATVQAELLPGKGAQTYGALTVIGSWVPATRCAGDFWTVHPLDEHRVLVTIGDVTGHGVASAMVTAAAVGACEVFVRRAADRGSVTGPKLVDLGELVHALDAAVRRVGGGELAMTCFASIIDTTAKSISYVSCGHTAPYVCRPAEKGVELTALVGRGNLLGVGVPTYPKVQQRTLETNDVVVWYTDGVIEAQDPAGKPFGDRRLQLLLKKLDKNRLTPQGVHDVVQAGVAAHCAGQPLGDDETVVVGQLRPS
jgi:serine phosphatase RsbU (regulator of sigma subunit)